MNQIQSDVRNNKNSECKKSKIEGDLWDEIYFIEPRVVKNVDAALVHDDWPVALNGGEGSRLQRIAAHSDSVLEVFDQRRREPDRRVEVRHVVEL